MIVGNYQGRDGKLQDVHNGDILKCHFEGDVIKSSWRGIEITWIPLYYGMMGYWTAQGFHAIGPIPGAHIPVMIGGER